MKSLLSCMCVLALFAGCDVKSRSTSQQSLPVDSASDGRADRDNTAVNVRDRDSAQKTPINQNENQQDVSITANIRKKVVDDDTLSVNAQNVKIITRNGHVTLRGPVKSDDEKKKIEAIATQIAGAGNTDNQLEVEAAP
jgi:hyperosmotically inducible periplasmic protein